MPVDLKELLQLRDWQQIKQRQAAEWAGTPEGTAALIEAKRYGLAAARIAELEREVAQWKNNHATVVAQARILKERTDMPIERVRAYENRQKATTERDALAAQNQVLRDSLVDTLYFLERNSNRWDGINGKHPFNIVESARAALALPDLSADILRARDAKVNAELLYALAAGQDAFDGGTGLLPFELRKIADELEQAR